MPAVPVRGQLVLSLPVAVAKGVLTVACVASYVFTWISALCSVNDVISFLLLKTLSSAKHSLPLRLSP